MVQRLIDEGQDINYRDKNNWTPLHCCASVGQLEICEALLKKDTITVTGGVDTVVGGNDNTAGGTGGDVGDTINTVDGDNDTVVGDNTGGAGATGADTITSDPAEVDNADNAP